MTRIVGLLALPLLLLLAGCGPAEEELAATIAARSNAVVAETLTARPTNTALPTGTAYPSLTALPTATSYPTATAYPTEAPWATATSYATWTPLPTDPPIATASPTGTAGRPAAGAATPAPEAPPVRDLLTLLYTARTDIELYGYLMDSAEQQSTTALDCPALVDVYQRVVNMPELDASGMDLTAQSAHSAYREAISTFQEKSYAVFEMCKKALDTGQESQIANYEWNLARGSLRGIISLLEPAIRALGGA